MLLNLLRALLLFAAPLALGIAVLYRYGDTSIGLILGILVTVVGAWRFLHLISFLPGLSIFRPHVQTTIAIAKAYRSIEKSESYGELPQPERHEAILFEVLRRRYPEWPYTPPHDRLLVGISQESGLLEFVLRVLGEEADLFQNEFEGALYLAKHVESALKRQLLSREILWGFGPRKELTMLLRELFLELGPKRA